MRFYSDYFWKHVRAKIGNIQIKWYKIILKLIYYKQVFIINENSKSSSIIDTK